MKELQEMFERYKPDVCNERNVVDQQILWNVD